MQRIATNSLRRMRPGALVDADKSLNQHTQQHGDRSRYSPGDNSLFQR
jgi:hypothetical protein